MSTTGTSLTTSQQRALSFDRHLAVTANAGTGKTMVLVRRYLRILLASKASLKQIVAITFTEKAASELRAKIAAHVRESLAQPLSREERRLLENVRDRLAGANIGTIHSFCAQLLREFPVEADVDAGFTVLEGVDQRLLLEEALQETFEGILGGGEGLREELFTAVRMLGRATVRQIVGQLLRKREQLRRLYEGALAGSRPDEEILGDWRKLIGETIEGLLTRDTTSRALRTIAALQSGKRAHEAAAAIEAFLALRSAEQRRAAAAALLASILTASGTIRKDVIGKEEPTPGTTAAERTLSDLQSALRGFPAEGDLITPADRTLLRLVRTLVAIALRVEERYGARKDESGYLDFDDLQFKTRDLLSHPDFGLRLREKFRYFMIDEFQDTNHLQYDIIRLLLGHAEEGNLFIVGDPKQSIYGFRNAEAEVFESARRELASGGRGEELVLAESFRLLPAIADFTNRLFSGLMDAADAPYGFPYEPLVDARRATADGRVEFLLPRADRTEDDPDENPALAQCRAIAQRISAMASSQTPIEPLQAGAARPFRFGDAAILVRDRRHVHELEQAFRESGIPYLLSGGTGYYQTQEVYDFLNYLTFLLDPDDDLALAGIFRSPFFTLTDANLFEIAQQGGTATLWQKAQDRALQPDAPAQLSRAVGILRDDLQLANRIPIPMLIQRIFRTTGWYGTVAGLRTGNQNAANMEKLLSLAREFEAQGFLTLYDFVERISSLAKEEEREGQAPIEQVDQSVHIMTIHAAKGLEFPVVFLPFLEKAFLEDHPPFIDPGSGIGFGVRDEANYDVKLEPSFTNHLRIRQRLKTETEEKRVLYVAVTRARDILVLTGDPGALGRKNSFLAWILSELRLTTETLAGGPIDLGSSPLGVLERKDGKEVRREILHSLTLHVERSAAGGTPDRRARTGTGSRPLFIAPVAGARSEEFYSATQLKTYLECPTKFFLKNILGLPQPGETPFHVSEFEDGNDAIRGDIAGSLTHAILQEIGAHAGAGPEIRKRIGRLVDATPFIDPGQRDEYIDAIDRLVEKFRESEIGMHVLAAPEALTEFTLTASLAEDFLTGTIDRLYRSSPENRWEILDYKTDRIGKKEIGGRAESYRIQLEVYALLVSRYFKQESVRATLLFLHHPESPVIFTFEPQQLREFESKFLKAIDGIKNRQFPQHLSSCPSCGYFADKRCPLPPFSPNDKR